MPEQASQFIYDADASPLVEANRQIVASLLHVEQETIKTIKVLADFETTEKGLIATTSKVTATLENGVQAHVQYKTVKDELVQVTKLQVIETEKETKAIEANTEAQKRNAAEIAQRQAAEAQRRGELALQTVRRGVQVPGRATEQELFNLAQAEGRLKEFAQKNQQISKDVVRIWNEVGRGAFNAYTGKLRELQRLLVNVKDAQQGLGTAADREAQQAANAIDREFKALDRLQQAQLKQAATQDRVAAREQAALNKRLNASGKIIEAERKSSQASQQASSTAVKGLKNQEVQAQSTAKGVQQVTLSWQSMARIVAIQYLHRAVSALTQAMEEAFDRASTLSIKIAEIQTISQDANVSTREWRQGLTDLSASFGIDAIDQAEAAYQALSNQVTQGADTFRFLEETNRFAVTAVTSSTNSVNLLTAAINAYRLSASDANNVAATLFKTIELGRVRADEMGQSFGDVAVLANQLGIGLDELGASIATLTIQGIKYNKAGTQLRGIFIKLLKPTKEMKQFLEDLGYSSGEAAIQALGLGKFLALLQERTKGSSTELAKFVSRIRGISGALALTGEGLELYNRNLAQIQNSQEDYNKATQIALDASGRRIKIFKEQVNQFTTEIATFWLDLAAQVAAALTGVNNNFSTTAKVIATILKYSSPLYLMFKGLRNLIATGNIFDSKDFDTRFKEAQKRQEALFKRVEGQVNVLRREIDNLFRSADREFSILDAKVIAGLSRQQREAIAAAKALTKVTIDGNKASIALIDELIKKQQDAAKQSEKIIDANEKAIEAAIRRAEAFADAFVLEELADSPVEQFKYLQERAQELILDAVKLFNLDEANKAFERLKQREDILIDLVKRGGELEKRKNDLIKERDKLELESGKTVLQLSDKEYARLQEIKKEIAAINALETDRKKLANQVLLAQEEEVRLRNELIEKEKEQLKLAKQREANLILQKAELTALATEFAKFDITKLTETRDVDKINAAMLRQADIVNRILAINKDIGVDAKTQQALVDRFNAEKKAAEAAIAKIRKENDREELKRTQDIAKERIKAVLDLLEAEKKRIELLKTERLPVFIRRLAGLDEQTKEVKELQRILAQVSKTGVISDAQIQGIKALAAAAERELGPKVVGALAGIERTLQELQSNRIPELQKAYENAKEQVKFFGQTADIAGAKLKDMSNKQDIFTEAIKASNTALDNWGAVLVRITEATLTANEKIRTATEALTLPPPRITEEPERKSLFEARGGQISAHGTDRIPALLGAGEFVVNQRATRRFFSQLLAINSGNIPRFGGGGSVTNVGDIQVSLQSSGNEPLDIVRIGKGLRREIRRGRVRLS